MCTAVVTFQFTMGSAFWVYASEVIVDSALGLCVFLMFGLLALESLLAIYIIQAIGVATTFYIFGGFQVVSVIILFFHMKETKHLDQITKKNLYRKNKIVNFSSEKRNK